MKLLNRINLGSTRVTVIWWDIDAPAGDCGQLGSTMPDVFMPYKSDDEAFIPEVGHIHGLKSKYPNFVSNYRAC